MVQENVPKQTILKTTILPLTRIMVGVSKKYFIRLFYAFTLLVAEENKN